MTDAEQKQYMLDWFKRQPASLDAKYAGSPREDEPNGQARPEKRERRHGHSERAVAEELDLHGEGIDQGIFAVEQLLIRAQSARYGCVRVIHGTGDIGSQATLRNQIKRWLNTKAGKWVERWEYDNANQGSVIIWLRQA
jgi:DNA-nicking Smr family endonuclease